MRQRPRTNIHEIIAEYFSKSRVDIENDVKEYLEKRVSRNIVCILETNNIQRLL